MELDRYTDEWKHMDRSTGTCTYEIYSEKYSDKYSKKYSMILCEEARKVSVVKHSHLENN